jgi:ABC-type lipoprotein export system ATPase subunit
MQELDVFTEQAEYIPKDSFEKWTTTHIDEDMIIKKLSHGGAKLIVGPRGCGKTTLMLKTYFSTAKSKSTLGVYVNYKSSLKLEPLYKNESSAQYWFNQWMLYKIIEGVITAINAIKQEKKIDGFYSKSTVSKSLSLLEMGRIDKLSDDDMLTVEGVVEKIEQCLVAIKRVRCVLLLDDAAHAFSSQQQQDFFELFRQIRRKNISPKAAVYPGVTNYSSTFHIGHDAEEIDVWMKPSAEKYLDFMHSILKSRFNNDFYEKLSSDINLINLLCYSSYGIPRTLLNVISKFCIEKNNESDELDIASFTVQKVVKEIKESFKSTYNIYESLRFKLPMYKSFIDLGDYVYEKMLVILKEYNKNYSNDPLRQTSIIAIKRPIMSELEKIFGFFQYAGLISSVSQSNRGDKGVYELYELHCSAIIDRNVFFSKRSINKENYCEAFSSRDARAYPRHTVESFLGGRDISKTVSLSLPPCSFCQTPRVSENAKFCSNCGAVLKEASIFENIINQDITVLPITKARAENIKRNCNIRTVKDILMDHDNSELQSVSMIGPHWCQRIKSYAEEVIA